MHTKDVLAEALREAKLPAMAEKAGRGYYHDYLSPLTYPQMQLVADLAQVGTPDALRLRQMVIDGAFDASEEEANQWADSEEGEETFRKFLGHTRHGAA